MMVVPVDLDTKFISKFNHSFTNRGCLHCAILRVLYGYKEKRAHMARDMQFLTSKCSKCDFQNFENVSKQHKIHQSNLLNYLKNRQ